MSQSMTDDSISMQRYVLLDSVQHDYLLALLGSSAGSRILSNGHAQDQPSTSGQSSSTPSVNVKHVFQNSHNA